MAQRPYHDKETLERLYYDESMNQQEIAEKFDVAHQTISEWMNKHGINPGIEAGQFDRVERASHFWGSHGYENVAAWNSDEKQMEHVKVHRLIAVAEWGFDNVQGKDVHHKDGFSLNNCAENLELVDPGEHMRKHIFSDHDPRERDENGYWKTTRS